MRNQRKIKNLLVSPPLQLRLVLVSMVSLLIAGIVVAFATSGIIGEAGQALAGASYAKPEAAEIINTARQFILTMMIATVSFSVLVAGAFVFVFSHRIAGASFAITRHINDKLSKGIYDSPLKLRDKDFLQEIADGLNKYAKSRSKK